MGRNKKNKSWISQSLPVSQWTTIQQTSTNTITMPMIKMQRTRIKITTRAIRRRVKMKAVSEHQL